MIRLKIITFTFLLLGCSQIHRIGLKDHSFSEQPRKIIWIQVAGFDLNHLGLLKFTNWNESRGDTLSNFICTGNMWQYDLYNLRPTAYSSMYSQVTGRNNSKDNKCDDYSQKPYWNILNQEKGFDFYLIEQNATKKESLLSGKSCVGSKNWFQNGFFLSRSGIKAPNVDQYFHYSENKRLEKDKIYYDRSCKEKSCFSTLHQTVNSLLESNLKNESKFIVHVRDFSYLRHLEQRNFKEAALVLHDIEKVQEMFTEKYDKTELLFIVSGVLGKALDYPTEGKDWKRFQKLSSSIPSKSTLLSPILSSGARSENFCGIYNQSEVFNRLFYVKKKFKLNIGN